MFKTCASFFALLLFNVNTFGQTPKFESSEDCLDWFLVSWDRVNNKSASLGNAHVSGTSSEGFVIAEWFDVRLDDRANNKLYRYVESRRTYADGEQSNLWEKRLIRGKEWKWCFGEYSQEIATVPAPEFDDKGIQKAGVNLAIKTPDVFLFSVVTGSAFESDLNSTKVSKIFEELKRDFDEADSEDDKLTGFFKGGGRFGVEIIFDKVVGGMPVSTRGYFRDQSKKGKPDKSFFTVMNFESKTRWETADKAKHFFVPISITNMVHKLNPTSKNSEVVEIQAAWEMDGISPELFSDDSLSKFRNSEGPLFELRAALKRKLDTSTLKSE